MFLTLPSSPPAVVGWQILEVTTRRLCLRSLWVHARAVVQRACDVIERGSVALASG